MSTEGVILSDEVVSGGRESEVTGNRALQSPVGTAAREEFPPSDPVAGWIETSMSAVTSLINASRWNHVVYPALVELEEGDIGFIPLTTGSVIKMVKGEELSYSTFFSIVDAPPVAEPGSAQDKSDAPPYASTDPLDRVHFTLDILGLAPVIGEPADLANSVLYFAEGDVLNGSLSVAAIIPFGGQTVTVTKFSKYGDELVSFGRRFDINKHHVLKGIDEEVHHLIPWELKNHDVVQAAAQDGFHMNDASNGIVLTGYKKFQEVIEEVLQVLFKLTPQEARTLEVRGLHATHPSYNKYVEFRLDEFASQFDRIEDIHPQEARQFIDQELLPELVTETINAANSVTKLNEHFKLLLAARGWN